MILPNWKLSDVAPAFELVIVPVIFGGIRAGIVKAQIRDVKRKGRNLAQQK
jgi:hypothetical protein